MVKSLIRSVKRITCFALLLIIAMVGINYSGKIDKVSAKVEKVQIQVGKPNVWSLSQAHYLLSKLRKSNKDLRINLPNETMLDPNRANTTRLEALRTFLGIAAEYSQKVGVENNMALNEQKDQLQNRENARKQLPEKQQELKDLNEQIFQLKVTEAELQAEEDASTPPTQTADNNQSKKNFPINPDPNLGRKKRLARLKVKIAELEAQKKALETEISDLKTKATATIGSTTLTEVGPPADSNRLEGLDLKGLMDKATKEGKVEAPTLAASATLDNFISMEYEIMAKQLTLLRDEANPDEEIIFLELPCSLYAVPGEADNYMAQVKWTVTSYFNGAPKKDDNSINVDAPKKDDNSINVENEKYKNQQKPFDFDMVEQKWKTNNKKAISLTKIDGFTQCNIDKTDNVGFVEAKGSSVRTVEVIPRQSALNISEYQATTRKFNFLGIAKLLSGIGLQVSYQRQKELYEQFLKQEIYASGFGKGNVDFGWTFGPVPGSRSIAPGARTTYAVMAVPKGTSILELSARGIAFNNKKPPKFNSDSTEWDMAQDATVLTEENFLVKIPSQYTESFYVNSIDYVPVKKGHKETVRIQGRSFSPQIGVLVNGVPLKWAMSIASNETVEDASSSTPTEDGIYGEFEYLNKEELSLNFAMPKNYTGTPTITLVTPTRSSAINYYGAEINGEKTSLQIKSIYEPMFMEDFSPQIKAEPVLDSNNKIKKLNLVGTGLRPNANVWINDKNKKEGDFNIHQLTTTRYVVEFTNPEENKKISGRFFQRTKQGFEETAFVYEPEKSPDTPPITHKVTRYIPNDGGLPALVDLQIQTKNKQPLKSIVLPPIYGRLVNYIDEGNGSYRVELEVKPNLLRAKFIERDTVALTLVDSTNTIAHVISLPIYPYINAIVNTETGAAEGNFAIEEKVVIRGRNLQNADSVLFGSAKGEILARNYDYVLVKVPAIVSQEKLSLSVILESLSGDGTKTFSNSLNYSYKQDKKEDEKDAKKDKKNKTQIKIIQKNSAIVDLSEIQ